MVSNEALPRSWKIPTDERLAVSATELSKASLHRRENENVRKVQEEGSPPPLLLGSSRFLMMSSKQSSARSSGLCCWCACPQFGSDRTACDFMNSFFQWSSLLAVSVLHTWTQSWMRHDPWPQRVLVSSCWGPCNPQARRMNRQEKGQFAQECSLFGELTQPTQITTEYKSEYVRADTYS